MGENGVAVILLQYKEVLAFRYIYYLSAIKQKANCRKLSLISDL